MFTLNIFDTLFQYLLFKLFFFFRSFFSLFFFFFFDTKLQSILYNVQFLTNIFCRCKYGDLREERS